MSAVKAIPGGFNTVRRYLRVKNAVEKFFASMAQGEGCSDR